MSYDIVELTPDANRIVFGGRLDAPTVSAMELTLTARIKGSGRHALLDLSAVDFVSSLGIRLLFSLARIVARQGRKAVLLGIQPTVMQIFETVSMNQVIPLAEDEAQALVVVSS